KICKVWNRNRGPDLWARPEEQFSHSFLLCLSHAACSRATCDQRRGRPQAVSHRRLHHVTGLRAEELWRNAPRRHDRSSRSRDLCERLLELLLAELHRLMQLCELDGDELHDLLQLLELVLLQRLQLQQILQLLRHDLEKLQQLLYRLRRVRVENRAWCLRERCVRRNRCTESERVHCHVTSLVFECEYGCAGLRVCVLS